MRFSSAISDESTAFMNSAYTLETSHEPISLPGDPREAMRARETRNYCIGKDYWLFGTRARTRKSQGGLTLAAGGPDGEAVSCLETCQPRDLKPTFKPRPMRRVPHPRVGRVGSALCSLGSALPPSCSYQVNLDCSTINPSDGHQPLDDRTGVHVIALLSQLAARIDTKVVVAADESQ
jgi:hypothetical protein